MSDEDYLGDGELYRLCNTGCHGLGLYLGTLLHCFKTPDAEAHEDLSHLHPWSRCSSQYCHHSPYALPEVLQHGQVSKRLFV